MSTSRRTSATYLHYDYDDRRARSEESHGLVLRPNREHAKNDESDDGRDDHLCLTYCEMRRRTAANQERATKKDTMDEWFEEHSRPRGRPQLSKWQSEDARVSPQIGRGSGAGKAAPRRPAGPPAPRPCRNPITPQGPYHSRDASDSSCWL